MYSRFVVSFYLIVLILSLLMTMAVSAPINDADRPKRHYPLLGLVGSVLTNAAYGGHYGTPYYGHSGYHGHHHHGYGGYNNYGYGYPHYGYY